MPAGAKPRQRDGRATYAGRLVFCLALAVAGKEKCSYSRRAGTSTIGRTSELNCAGRDNSLVPRLDELQINRSTDEIITAFLYPPPLSSIPPNPHHQKPWACMFCRQLRSFLFSKSAARYSC